MRTARLKTNLGKQKQLSHCASVTLNLFFFFLTFQTFIKYFTVLILITQEMLLKFYYTG